MTFAMGDNLLGREQTLVKPGLFRIPVIKELETAPLLSNFYKFYSLFH